MKYAYTLKQDHDRIRVFSSFDKMSSVLITRLKEKAKDGTAFIMNHFSSDGTDRLYSGSNEVLMKIKEALQIYTQVEISLRFSVKDVAGGNQKTIIYIEKTEINPTY